MKIAVATNTGDIVGQHFGRVTQYRVFTIADGKITGDELREKPTMHGAHHHPHSGTSPEGHGYGTEARQHHLTMIDPIRDCDVLIAGMMGRGAYEHIQDAGIKVVLTDETFVENTVTAFLDGRLRNKLEERVH